MKEFTYLSENIEKHAKPNNTCCLYDEQSFIKNEHPFLHAIPKYTLEEDEIKIMNSLKNMGYLKETNDSYIRTTHHGFPRLLIQIKDKQLKQLSEDTHPEVYEYQNTLPRNLQRWCDTLNDITVSQILDNKTAKVGFEKILYPIEDPIVPEVMMYGKNKQTLFAAAKRQIKTAPLPNAHMAKHFILYAQQKIEEDIGEYLNNFGYNEAQWYSHLPAGKQQQIKPIRTYYRNPEIFNLIYTQSEKNKILSYEYEAIVKAELQPTDGKPRMVCSIPQRTKYAMGPVTWQLEEICAKHLKGYCGGKNLTEMAEEINDIYRQGFTKVVEGDGSAFDNSQDVTLKAIDRYIYQRVSNAVYHVPKQEFLKQAHKHYKTMNVKYVEDNKKITYLTYKVLGTVFSGDADTTLANTIRMAMYNRYANDMSGLRYGIDYVCFSKGDDFSVFYKPYVQDEVIRSIYEKYFLPKPTEAFEICDTRQGGLGQICKFLDIGGPNSLKFCSLRAWYKNPQTDDITLTRNPAKLYNLSKYAIKTKTYRPAQRVAYHLSQALAYQANYEGIKVFDLMRYAHMFEAIKIYELHKHEPKFFKSYQSEYNKLLRQKEREETYDFGCGELLNNKLRELYNVQDRDQFEDLIYNNYWQNMQAKYNQRNEVNTIEELKYINDQIEEEFCTEELKSQLGLLGRIKILEQLDASKIQQQTTKQKSWN